jgi:uncharacterized repeat protein (TIGR03943 family)
MRKKTNKAIFKYAKMAQTLWLVLFPLLVLELASKTKLRNFLNPKYIWIVYAGIDIILAIGVGVFALRFKNLKLEGPAEGSAFWTVFWTALIFVPLVLGQVLGNQPLASDRTARDQAVKSMVAPAAKSANGGTLKADTSGWSFNDWFVAVSSDPEPSHFECKEASIDGQVFDFNEGAFYLSRYKIWCCAADAVAVNMPVQYKKTSELKDGQWVEVSGVMKAATWHGTRALVLFANSVTQEKQPNDPYIY